MGKFTETSKNIMLDALTVTYASLHDDDPGITGANELTGGDPAYARKPCVFNAANGGARALNADVTFDVPAGATVLYVGYWSEIAGDFRGSDLVTQEDYTGQGQYIAYAAGTSLSLPDES